MFIKLVDQNLNKPYVHNNSNDKVERITNTEFQNNLNKFRQPRNTKDYKNASKNKISEIASYCPYVKSNKSLSHINLNDEEQTLIEDEKTYERFNVREYGIEFNSEKFEIWKKEHNYNTYPPLDSPWQVRRTFREMEESIKDDPILSEELDSLKLHLNSIMLHPEDFDYPKDLDFSNPDSYYKLIDLIINKLKDVHAIVPHKNCLKDATMLNKILSILKIHNQYVASTLYIKHKN
ncbi:hypothetical protein [Clostridium frigidicarnis]|uniref:Uncharacterized protein n=1 Tax=Clostridium frigidicarnis TaxID=84698 RepID=A0A1I0ZWY2_9CLOT|nr:hypothetical protein [Clostridium frigidicarnis]SFB30265.1 hypothetical protein SAMN04488528_10273 [Clostridium frigidicarnis]